MPAITIYHNPRCSKSRQALALLEEKGLKPVVIEYLVTPPSKQTLKELLGMLDISPRDLMRKNEGDYKNLNLNDSALSDEALIESMIAHPKLIQRPIVTHGKQAAIGRPFGNILEILP